MPWIVKRFGLKPGDKLLDVGCGNGDGVMAFREAGMAAIGVDRHKNDLKRSVVADIEKKLPFPAKTFDVAFCKSVIEHVQSPVKMVEAVLQVLKPGGKFIILSPDWVYCVKGFYSDPTHVWPMTHHGIAGLLDLHGFTTLSKELFRPCGILINHPVLAPFLIALTYVIPYRWLGGLKYAHRKHFMSLVCGVKD
jgi:ubiquinone/menaquinone biosynthesis C-methylase UbiE